MTRMVSPEPAGREAGLARQQIRDRLADPFEPESRIQPLSARYSSIREEMDQSGAICQSLGDRDRGQEGRVASLAVCGNRPDGRQVGGPVECHTPRRRDRPFVLEQQEGGSAETAGGGERFGSERRDAIRFDVERLDKDPGNIHRPGCGTRADVFNSQCRPLADRASQCQRRPGVSKGHGTVFAHDTEAGVNEASFEIWRLSADGKGPHVRESPKRGEQRDNLIEASVEGRRIRWPGHPDEAIPEWLRVRRIVQEDAIAEAAQLALGASMNERFVPGQPTSERGVNNEGRQHARWKNQAEGERCRAKSVAPEGSSMTAGAGVPAAANQAR